MQQALSKSQGEEVPGKTEKIEEDALPERNRMILLTIASKSTIYKVTLDPDVPPEVAIEEGATRDEPLSE